MNARMRCTVGFLAVAAAVGCGGNDSFELGTDPSTGALGVAEFSWEENGLFSCLFGCNAAAPVATGATASLRVGNAASIPAFTVRSDDPTTAQVSGTSPIEIEALRPGEARILLEEYPGGAPIDELVVTIADVHRITAGKRRLIAVDGSMEIEPFLFDAWGRRLVGIGALDYAPSPSLDQGQLSVSDRCEMFFSLQVEECVRLSAVDVGEGFLEIEAASGVAASVPLDLVVDDDVVTSINLQKEPDDDRIVVRARAFAGDARVFGARCDWSLTLSEGSLYIDSIDHDDEEEATIRGRGAGDLTCEIGNASRNVSLRRD